MVNIPGFLSAWQIVDNCVSKPAEKTSIAMTIFLSEWEKEFGPSEEVRKNLNEIMIEWSGDEKGGTGFSEDGHPVENATFSGLTLIKTMIWVKEDSNSPLICETSLAHELTHASIWALKGTDGDPDHLGTKYYGWSIRHSLVIQRTNQRLCRLGI